MVTLAGDSLRKVCSKGQLAVLDSINVSPLQKGPEIVKVDMYSRNCL